MATRKKRKSSKSTVRKKTGRTITIRIVGGTASIVGAKAKRKAPKRKSSTSKRKAPKRRATKRKSPARKPSTRGAATRSKHDGGVSHARAIRYGKMAARMGFTIHTGTGKRPHGYTKADAIVAQRAKSAELARLR